MHIGMKNTVFLAACLVAGGAWAGMAPPIHAVAPASLPAGAVELRCGFDYSYDEQSMFQTAVAKKELYRLPDLTLTVGMSDRVELVFNFPWLWLKQDGASTKTGPGDLKITGIYNLVKETDSAPACSLILATKLPDANYDKGLGTDRTDFWAGGAFSKTVGRLYLLANASLGLLDKPTGETDQDDVFVYDVGAIYSITHDLSAGCGLDGIYNSRFGNDRIVVRGGIALKTDFGTFDLSAGTGLNRYSGDLHVTTGFSTAFAF